MVDHLPAWSNFGAALTDDDEYAELFAGRDADPTPPSIAEWTPLVDAVNAAVDRLGDLIAMSARGKVNIPPRPRPVTAVDRAKDRRRRQRSAALEKRLLPPTSPDDAADPGD